jgi:protein TonB
MKNVRPKIWALAMASAVLFFAACNSDNYTKSPANEPESTSANSDTTMNNTPMTDTTMGNRSADTSMNKSGATKKQSVSSKKRKISVGAMTEKRTNNMKPDKSGIYEFTDVRPSYPGGQDALENYINNNIEYQSPAIGDNTEGTVNVQFVVDENGNVTSAKTIGNELGSGLDREAVRVISNMPKWNPGKVKGKNVKTRLVLPITYKIEE